MRRRRAGYAEVPPDVSPVLRRALSQAAEERYE